GWTGDHEWTGWVPFDALPHLYDPPDHFIVTANHRPAPASYTYNLGVEWTEPYRAQRIVDLLRDRARLTTADFATIQADTVSLHAKGLRRVLLAHAQKSAADLAPALDLLEKWNAESQGDRTAPAVFAAWFHELAASLAGDELGPVVTDNYAGRFT